MSRSEDANDVRAAGDDADALSGLLRKYGPQVRNKLEISPRWQAVLEADDVMQVTYLEAFLQIERYDPNRGSSFFGWLKQIADNNLKDAIRALESDKRLPPERRLPEQAPSDSMVGLLERLCVTTTTPSRHAARSDMVRVLESVMGCLPEDYAKAVRLYDLEGLPVADVAAAMKRSTGAVHMLRARAHDRLRQLLGSESQFFSGAG